jgi:hypothetical protein
VSPFGGMDRDTYMQCLEKKLGVGESDHVATQNGDTIPGWWFGTFFIFHNI